MTEKLLPCPFCGHAAEWNKEKNGDGSDWHYIACSECEAMGPYFKTRQEQIDKWNDRTYLTIIRQIKEFFIHSPGTFGITLPDDAQEIYKGICERGLKAITNLEKEKPNEQNPA